MPIGRLEPTASSGSDSNTTAATTLFRRYRVTLHVFGRGREPESRNNEITNVNTDTNAHNLRADGAARRHSSAETEPESDLYAGRELRNPLSH